MTDNIIKCYLMEKIYDENPALDIPFFKEMFYADLMFEKFKKGELSINKVDFNSWLTKKQRSNEEFKRFLNYMGLVDNKKRTLELYFDGSLSWDGDQQFYSETTPFDFSLNKISLNEQIILNGIFDNQLLSLAKLLEDDSILFSIGFSGNMNSEYTKKLLKYYEKLKDLLLQINRSLDISTLEQEDINGKKIYILTNNFN